MAAARRGRDDRSVAADGADDSGGRSGGRRDGFGGSIKAVQELFYGSLGEIFEYAVSKHGYGGISKGSVKSAFETEIAERGNRAEIALASADVVIGAALDRIEGLSPAQRRFLNDVVDTITDALKRAARDGRLEDIARTATALAYTLKGKVDELVKTRQQAQPAGAKRVETIAALSPEDRVTLRLLLRDLSDSRAPQHVTVLKELNQHLDDGRLTVAMLAEALAQPHVRDVLDALRVFLGTPKAPEPGLAGQAKDALSSLLPGRPESPLVRDTKAAVKAVTADLRRSEATNNDILRRTAAAETKRKYWWL